jgi:hypothetical protein
MIPGLEFYRGTRLVVVQEDNDVDQCGQRI